MNILANIGIIGGADGPTQIVLSMSNDPSLILVVSVLLSAASFGMIAWRRKHH